MAARTDPKRARGSYSRAICLGCRDRRIRCKLPGDVEIPGPDELRTTQAPCHRCKNLNIPCVIRQTVLGRPGPKGGSTVVTPANVRSAGNDNDHSRVVVDLSPVAVTRAQPTTFQHDKQSTSSSTVLTIRSRSPETPAWSKRSPAHWSEDSLLIHTPQSNETLITIRALDTLRCERMEDEWPRHLPGRFGHTQALDLSVKASVAASAYARGLPRLTSTDCYQALALALSAVQAKVRQAREAHETSSDDLLAATALLAPFEGMVKSNGIPTGLHVQGLAAILATRPATYPVTQLARDIFDYNAAESAVMSCVQDTCCPFENVSRAYYTNDRIGYSDCDQAQLKALATELFIRLPRLVKLFRELRSRPLTQSQLFSDAFGLSKSLLRLQDSEAEVRLLWSVSVRSARIPSTQSLHFTSVKDFEALTYYWQSRLCLLRLEWRLHHLSASSDAQAGMKEEPNSFFSLGSESRVREMLRLARNLLMSSEYAESLVLNKQCRLFTHAMVVVWGAIKDVPTALLQSQAREPPDFLPDIVLQAANDVLRKKPDLTPEDMDVAADIFVGGPPRGRLAMRFGL